MRRSYGRLLFLFLFGFECLLVPIASADNTAQYTVVAAVAPARYIIVDSNNRITKILSNTSQDVQPMVYYRSVKTGNKRNLNSSLLKSYNSIMTNANSNDPVIYNNRPPSLADVSRQNGLLSLVSVMYNL